MTGLRAKQLRQPRPQRVAGTDALVVLVAVRRAMLRRWLVQKLSPSVILRPAGDLESLKEVVTSVRLDGAIVEDALDPELELVRSLRSGARPRPVLVVSAASDAMTASHISGLGASFISEGEEREVMQRRALALIEAVRERHDPIGWLIERRAQQHQLTPGERRLLLAYVASGRRDRLAQSLGVAETSVRSCVRRTCRKLDISRLSGVYRLLLDDALE